MPVEQGQSQRRSLGNDGNTLVGQAADAQPKSSSGESYVSLILGPATSSDYGPSKYVGALETDITLIGNFPIEAVSSGSRSQSQGRAINDGVDSGQIFRTSRKEVGITPLNASASPIETSSHGTSYLPSIAGAPTTFGSAAAVSTTTTYYKLRARDTGAGYVEWVTTVTPLSTASYPGTPVGSLVDLTLLSEITVST